MAFMRQRRRGWVVGLFFVGMACAAESQEAGLHYESLLTGTRQRYNDVRVRAFDPRTGRVTILCREGLANVALEDFPEKDRPLILAGRRLDNRVAASTPGSLRVVVRERMVDVSATGTATDPESIEGRIEKAVQNRARGYFKFNYAPKGTFHHCRFEILGKPPVEIAGWAGRYLVEGEVVYSLFESHGENIGTEIVGWEAVVQSREGEIEILEFRNH
jgi:hypothetical protein